MRLYYINMFLYLKLFIELKEVIRQKSVFDDQIESEMKEIRRLELVCKNIS